METGPSSFTKCSRQTVLPHPRPTNPPPIPPPTVFFRSANAPSLFTSCSSVLIRPTKKRNDGWMEIAVSSQYRMRIFTRPDCTNESRSSDFSRGQETKEIPAARSSWSALILRAETPTFFCLPCHKLGCSERTFFRFKTSSLRFSRIGICCGILFGRAAPPAINVFPHSLSSPRGIFWPQSFFWL